MYVVQVLALYTNSDVTIESGNKLYHNLYRRARTTNMLLKELERLVLVNANTPPKCTNTEKRNIALLHSGYISKDLVCIIK